MAAAIAVTLPILLCQLWSFLAPAIEEGTQRIVSIFAAFATLLFAGGIAFALLHRPAPALYFLTNFNDDLFNIQIRASYYFSFVTADPAGERPRLRDADLHPRARPPAGAERRGLRRNRRTGFALMLVFAILLPTVDPVSLAFEVLPLVVLFELSI